MGGGQVSESMTGLFKPQVRELAPRGRPGLGSLPNLSIQPGQSRFQGPRGKNARVSSQAGCPAGGEQAMHPLAMMVSEVRTPSWDPGIQFLYLSLLSEQEEEGVGFLVHGAA